MTFVWAKEVYTNFQRKHSETERIRAIILFWLQLAIIILLIAVLILISVVDNNERLLLYITLVSGLLLAMIVAIILNLSGRYRFTAWLTTLCVLLGPWFSILLDNSVMTGDFVPLVYITFSIQLCAILLSVRATLGITIIQVISLLLIIFLNEGLSQINWPSLLFFVLFSSTLGIVSSYITRNQMEKIEKQKQQLQETGIQLREMSVRDSLTGLFNRRYMEETLEREIDNAIRKNRNLAIIMADINKFKIINDNFGHGMGDYVLRGVSEILMTKIRHSDVASRYGGDEFVLILSDCDLDHATKRMALIHEELKNKIFEFDGKVLKNVSLSFGVAALPDNGLTCRDLLRVVDEALYVQKRRL